MDVSRRDGFEDRSGKRESREMGFSGPAIYTVSIWRMGDGREVSQNVG
jgi:hypothetical protein